MGRETLEGSSGDYVNTGENGGTGNNNNKKQWREGDSRDNGGSVENADTVGSETKGDIEMRDTREKKIL